MSEANPIVLLLRAQGAVATALAGFACLVALGVGAAENPVAVESLTDEAEPANVSTTTEAIAPPGSIGELSDEVAFQAPVMADAGGFEEEYQIQLLQQEVSELRGLIEELKHAIDTTKRLSDDRYLELDGRFQALRGAANPAVERQQSPIPTNTPGQGSAAATEAPRQPGDVQTGDVDIAATVLGEATEQSLYDTALELIRNRQYEVAITQLQAMIDQHPEGELAPNGYYWLGEVHAAMPEPDYEQARQALAQVITFFPEHDKVPAAAFKLGKVYHLMGDCGRAVETLRSVIADHPGKSVGKLAEAYLRDKVDCGQG